MAKGRPRLRTIGGTVEKLTRPIFGKRGFAEAAIVTDWGAIVGEAFARHTRPDRVSYPPHKRSGGTLHVRIDSSALALELQHLQPQLIERINSYFGYGAIAGVRIVQAPAILAEKEKKPADAEPERETATAPLDERLKSVTDPDLRAALEALGAEVFAAPKSGSSN
jgi:hypothetical protein